MILKPIDYHLITSQNVERDVTPPQEKSPVPDSSHEILSHLVRRIQEDIDEGSLAPFGFPDKEWTKIFPKPWVQAQTYVKRGKVDGAKADNLLGRLVALIEGLWQAKVPLTGTNVTYTFGFWPYEMQMAKSHVKRQAFLGPLKKSA